MYRGSEKYFVGVLIARFGFLYGAGSAVNSAIQLLAINIHLIGRGEPTFETLPYFLNKVILVMIPFKPPFDAIDALSVLFNVVIAVLIAASWTVSWSDGMYQYHGR